ncbi:MAG: hypothetical protein JW743_06810 [Deltaproteobacteria bacterium]|nr:hypothetical protein [Deltaproteobacteria bacterium]MBN2687086.1 hypothetical protein [Deltaproteobacteria bacterium]
MSGNTKIRWGWLKGMYIYTIVLSGFLGLGILVVPEVIKTKFPWPVEEPTAFGIIGSVYVAFGLLSILGLRSPLKFVPVLLMQLCYKLVWFVGVLIPLLVTARFPSYAISMVIIFITFIIGDLIAIPFRYVFAKSSNQ